MTTWTLATWVSIAVLIFGSLAVFGWFLVDAHRFLRGLGRTDAPGGEPTRRPSEPRSPDADE